MIDTFDIKAGERPTNVELEMLNYLHEKKLTGEVPPTAFADLILYTLGLSANCTRRGKMSKEDRESTKAFITHLTGDSASKFYNLPHANLKEAGIAGLENLEMAEYDLEKRNEYAQPVMSADSYESTFRKLGH